MFTEAKRIELRDKSTQSLQSFKSLWNRLLDSLTWKQFQSLPRSTKYIDSLNAARHLTNNKRIHTLIDQTEIALGQWIESHNEYVNYLKLDTDEVI